MAKKRAKVVRNVCPDAVDFRDLSFRLNVALPPQSFPTQALRLRVKNQGETSACTGFSLSLVVEHLLRAGGRDAPVV